MVIKQFRKSVLAGGLLLALAACNTAEEKADAYLSSAVELIEQGDTDRAIVELRNVFEFVPNHVEARLTLARLFLKEEQYAAAYSNYLRLVEQTPENFEGRIALAEISFNSRNWEEFARHGAAAVELDADNSRSKAVQLGLEYRQAVLDDDGPRQEATLIDVEALAVDLPENTILRQVKLDNYSREGETEKALEMLRQLIATKPDERQYYDQRLALLSRAGDEVALESNLREMVTQFPDDNDVKSNLIQFLIRGQKLDEAEAFLRDISDPADEDPSLFIDLVRFVTQTKGVEAALTELDAGIAASPSPDRLRAMRASMSFSIGDQDEALAAMEDIIANAEPSEQTNDIKNLLANMLIARDNDVGAQRLIDEVLAEDPTHVPSLKLKSAWQIEADDIDLAISTLRTALDNAPEDVQAMSQMALAYTRAGSHDLARDFMALAVDASNNSPQTSLRYATVLINEEQYLAAEDVLLPALRREPGNVQVLARLGNVYMLMEDFGRVDGVVDALRRLEGEPAEAAANQLELSLLNEREGIEQALKFIEDAAGAEDASTGTRLALIRARLGTNQPEEALALAQAMVEDLPDNTQALFVLATVQMATGDLSTSEATYRGVLERDNTLASAWLNLSRSLERQGRDDDAIAVLSEASEIIPDDQTIIWAQASWMERQGKIDEAITAYERLYTLNSGSLVAANNLASLLSSHSPTTESLDRAWAIARRLSDTDVPQFQDTYGRLAFLRGDAQGSISYLENAAAKLVNDPVVQFHLAEAYEAVDRTQEALEQYRKAVEKAPEGNDRPEIIRAQDAITRLTAESPSTD